MATDQDLKKMLDDWEARMAADSKLVDQINLYRKDAYDQLGTAARDRVFLGTDEATRRANAATVRKSTEEAIKSSPELKADFIKEIGDGHIKKIEIGSKDMGAGGAYDGKNDLMYINPAIALTASRKGPERNELIGIIGHELDHSQERDKGRTADKAFITEAEKILNDGKQAHDFTKVIGDKVAERSASESRAHLEYYNSIVLSLDKKDRTEAKIFAAIPDDRKKDFFDVAKGKLHPGLTISPPGSGLLPQTDDNIKVLQKTFFERPQFGPNNRETYKQQVATELVRAILDVDKAKDVTINLKQMGVDYNAIQPNLKFADGKPRTFYDNSDGTKIKLETDKPHSLVPPKAIPVSPIPGGLPGGLPGSQPQRLPVSAEAGSQAHPLYEQALQHVQALGPQAGGYRNPQEMERVAGALAAQAQSNHLPSITTVVASTDGKGLIAAWTNPDNPLDTNRVYQEKAQAAAQPLEQSLQQLKAGEQTGSLPPQQTESQAQGFSR